ncbi:MAG: hypothetical protein ACK46D_08485, partial [Roseiflexaceae bacterium]
MVRSMTCARSSSWHRRKASVPSFPQITIWANLDEKMPRPRSGHGMTERGYDGAGCGRGHEGEGCGAIDDLRPLLVMASAQGVGA